MIQSQIFRHSNHNNLILQNPIQLSTHSIMDYTTFSVKYSIMYDYNYLAGFIAVAPSPAELSIV